MAKEAWRRRSILELRYDGPVPAWEYPVPDAVTALRRRMRLHRRLALGYVRALVWAPDDAARLRRLLAAERRSHSRLARQLGEVLRYPLFAALAPPHV